MSKQKILEKYLSRLKPDQLEEFKKKLCTMDPPQGTNKIKTSQLRIKSAKEIAELIVECYTIQKGPPHVVNVFKNINLNQKATDLQKELKQVATTQQTVETPNNSATTVCNPPKIPKAKASTSQKIKDVKPTAVTNNVVGPSSKPTKKTTGDGIPGTSQNTEQTSTKTKAPKRKLDQSKKDQIDEQQTQPIKVPKHGELSKYDLSKYIKELTDESFKEFKTCLNDKDVLKPYKEIPKASLEKADRLDVAGLLINFYTKEKAPNVTIKILKKIGEADLAKQMQSKIGVK
ncbi:uncharacterized protein [Aquarana catesbeiana]|uniref:uncharacterized protein n=1 Tax=Aquarana catesbeiana TaxID=8400 RepID=UPI003CCA658F